MYKEFEACVTTPVMPRGLRERPDGMRRDERPRRARGCGAAGWKADDRPIKGY